MFFLIAVEKRRYADGQQPTYQVYGEFDRSYEKSRIEALATQIILRYYCNWSNAYPANQAFRASDDLEVRLPIGRTAG